MICFLCCPVYATVPFISPLLGNLDQVRMNQQRNHRQLHFARRDLFAEILGCASDHEPGDEHADDQIQQQVNHAYALAAVDAVEPHAGLSRGA